MRRAALPGLLLALVLGAGGGGAAGQAPTTPAPLHPGPGRMPTMPDDAAHASDDLDCRACHQRKHLGVVDMYVGRGGRGAPAMPSHMYQVRVECVACHVAPKALEPGVAELVGKTFVPSEQACLGCHGEQYRGMLARWSSTLARMTAIVTPKVAAARAALAAADPGRPGLARAREIVGDAEANLRFVTLGRGVHNVFYAAALLRRTNGWADEAMAALGKASRSDDALVRGGYCAVMCHEQAGVRERASVTFGGTRLPHGRHTRELGVTCTACHSAEVHKTLTATPATCSGCHHGAQNDRCETCHRSQAAFYRGRTATAEVPITPNRMAEAVPCTGCHDFTRKHSRAAVGETCLACHDATYMPLMAEWTTGFDRDLQATAAALGEAQRALARARKSGRPSAAAEGLLKQAREAHGLVKAGGVPHNPLAADALLESARRKAEQARDRSGR
jgi:hypothetical protein